MRDHFILRDEHPDFALSKKQLKSLEVALKVNNSELVDRLAELIERGAFKYWELNKYYYDRITVNKFKKVLSDLEKLLIKAERKLEEIPHTTERVLDDYFYFQNNKDRSWLDNTLTWDKSSAFAYNLHGMIKAVRAWEADCFDDNDRIDPHLLSALRVLAEGFESIVSELGVNHKVTSSDGVFSRFYLFFLTEVLGLEFVDPAHQIEKYLKERESVQK